MQTFYLIILIPIIWALISKLVFVKHISWIEMAIQMAVSILIIGGVLAAGQYGQMVDTEVLSGQVTEKHRDHGYWEESYDCYCTNVCTGSGENESCHEVCQTCYRDHYTVDWYLSSTLGNISIDSIDRESRSVYNTPDPALFAQAYKGQPCSKTRRYDNYIKAVPESLFNMENDPALEQFAGMIPTYPSLYDIYFIDRVLAVGVKVPNLQIWNDHLSLQMKTIGPQKQANINIVLVNTADQTYRYALEKAWLGGKKNDVTVILGVPDFPKIAWVDTITLGQNAGNSLMTVEMRDLIMALGTAEDPIKTVNAIAAIVLVRFDRKPMTDYAYLKDEIEPPTWVLILAVILSILISIGLTMLFHRNDDF